MMTTSPVPIGFRFRPTVQETLIRFLKPKIFDEPLPPNNPILEVNIYSCHPSELFNDLEDNDEYEIQRYFYTTLKKGSENGRNYIRRIKDVGKWDGEYPKAILDNHGEVIGFDKYFKFVPVKKDSDKTREWNMHEYSIKPELLPQGIDEEKKNLVVCRMVMIVKGNSQAKNKSRVIRLSKAQPLSCSNAVAANMMMMHPPQINYAFTAEQEKEPTWKTQGTDEITVGNSENHAIVRSSDLSGNILGPSNGINGSSNMEGNGERIELHNGFQNPPMGDASNANMMVMHPPQVNYVFTAEQEKEPTWSNTQEIDQIIVGNSEDHAIVCSDFSSNIFGPSYGIDGSSNMGGIGEGIELYNGYDNGFQNPPMGENSYVNMMMMMHSPQINYARQAEEPLWKQASDQTIVDNSEDHTTTCSNFSSNVDQSYGGVGSNNMEGVGEGLELYNNGYDYGFQNPPMGDDNNVNMMMMHPPQVANVLDAQEQEKLNQLEAFLLSSDWLAS